MVRSADSTPGSARHRQSTRPAWHTHATRSGPAERAVATGVQVHYAVLPPSAEAPDADPGLQTPLALSFSHIPHSPTYTDLAGLALSLATSVRLHRASTLHLVAISRLHVIIIIHQPPGSRDMRRDCITPPCHYHTPSHRRTRHHSSRRPRPGGWRPYRTLKHQLGLRSRAHAVLYILPGPIH